MKNDEALYPTFVNTKEGKKYGYINEKGKFIIKPRYSLAGKFDINGYAVVQTDNKMGVINKKNEFVVKPIYEYISDFKDGRANASTKEGTIVIDYNGNNITKKSYSFIGEYNEGLALVADIAEDGNYKYGYIDLDGNEIIPLTYSIANEFKDSVAVVKDSSYKLINNKGDLLESYVYPYVGGYGDGLLLYQEELGGKYGYINKRGEVVIAPTYYIAEPFINRLAIVSVSDKYNGPFGVINIKGDFIFKPIYSNIKNLRDGKVALGMPHGNKEFNRSIYAIGDSNKKILSAFSYIDVSEYKDKLASAYDEETTYFLNEKGRIDETLPCVKGSGTLTLENNLIYANIDYNPYYINKKGKIIYEPNSVIPLNDKYEVRSIKYKPNVDYLVYYPQVKGLKSKEAQYKINNELSKMVELKPVKKDEVLDYSYYGNFEIFYYQKNILVLDISGYNYPLGAAHGMPTKKTPTINLLTGEIYSLGNLFMGGVYWVGELNKIIEKKIKEDKEYEYVYQDGFKGIDTETGFYVDKDNLYIYFTPYEIAPYAAGFVTFKIPFKDIEGMINKKGSFWRALN